MQLRRSTAEIFVPDGLPPAEALARVTHLGIGAHHDDLEFMAYHGISECFMSDAMWFGGVTCTDGSGSARSGAYASCEDGAMRAIRRREQNAAAIVGRFAAMVQLDHSSGSVKAENGELVSDLGEVLRTARPEVVYTHNPADKHETHVAVFAAVLKALRELPPALQPKAVYGCEVWRDLDWVLDSEKVALDVSAREHLALALSGIFDSQISGGKRYDLATLGRRRANATFFQSHATDQAEMLSFALDLMPLVRDPALDVIDYTCGFIDRLKADVRGKLERYFHPR